MNKQQEQSTNKKTFTFGDKELKINRTYEVMSMLNDALLGVWFAVGSFCFFYEGTIKTVGVWLFVVGSVQLLLRPLIRLHRYITLGRMPSNSQNF